MHNLASSGSGPVPLDITLWLLLAAAYWVPTLVALIRHVPAKAQVVIVNLFLGWTFVGWVVALVMAFRQVPQRPAEPTR